MVTSGTTGTAGMAGTTELLYCLCYIFDLDVKVLDNIQVW